MPSLTLAGNYFYNEIDDLIDWDTTKSPAEYANIREAKVEGIKLELNGALARGRHWALNYMYQDPRDRNTDEKVPYFPSHRVTASFTYRINKNFDYT